MKNVILFSALMLSVGCTKGMINVTAVDGLIQEVTARHDTYVGKDMTLTDAQKATYYRSASLLRDVVAAAKQ